MKSLYLMLFMIILMVVIMTGIFMPAKAVTFADTRKGSKCWKSVIHENLFEATI